MRVHALWAACSDAGCSIDGTRKTNQDSYLVDAPRSGELLIGVFDGHGEHGHHVSQQCKTQFADMLRTASQSHPNLQSATTAAYVEQDHACTLALDCSQSGTTAVTCHLQGDELSGQVTITTAWAGDSRAVLAQVKPCGGVVTRDLSVDQKPERPDEKARIEKFGGVCEPVFDVCQLVERLAGRPTYSGPGQPRSPPRRTALVASKTAIARGHPRSSFPAFAPGTGPAVRPDAGVVSGAGGARACDVALNWRRGGRDGGRDSGARGLAGSARPRGLLRAGLLGRDLGVSGEPWRSWWTPTWPALGLQPLSPRHGFQGQSRSSAPQNAA
jgi:hypothetical protein